MGKSKNKMIGRRQLYTLIRRETIKNRYSATADNSPIVERNINTNSDAISNNDFKVRSQPKYLCDVLRNWYITHFRYAKNIKITRYG